MKRNNPEPVKDGANQWLAFLNLGWILALTMAICVGGGLWLDRHFGTMPILLIGGVFLGFFGCGYSLYRAVRKLESQESPKPGE